MPKFEVFAQRTMIQQSIFYQPPIGAATEEVWIEEIEDGEEVA